MGVNGVIERTSATEAKLDGTKHRAN